MRRAKKHHYAYDTMLDGTCNSIMLTGEISQYPASYAMDWTEFSYEKEQNME